MDPTVSEKKFTREVDLLCGAAGGFAVARGWEIIARSFPTLAILFTHPQSKRKVLFCFCFDGWDELPPALSLFDPESNIDLAWDKWPKGGWSAHGSHPVTGKPFLCLPGIREYHTHSSHLQDKWENFKAKGTYTLGHIIDRVWQRFKDTNG